MTILGIKLTHDGALALIDNGRLVFSYEMEKLDNMPRHSHFCITMERIKEILSGHGYDLKAIDQWVIDGWDTGHDENITTGHDEIQYDIAIPLDDNRKIKIDELAAYGHFVGKEENILLPSHFKVATHDLYYKSYQHVSGHLMSAYCTSPFPEKEESSFILVWDGGMPPQLFYYNYQKNEVQNIGPLFFLAGYIYINFAHAFEPFCLSGKSLSIAGKAMAYVALGEVRAEIMEMFKKIFASLNETVKKHEVNMEIVAILTGEFIREARNFCVSRKLDHRDMLATFQAFIQELLVSNLEKKVKEHPELVNNFCFAGGSALNIKWNNAIRNSGIFRKMWVPPFPNDAGSAIGTACCEMLMHDNRRKLRWDVYSGPLIEQAAFDDRRYAACTCTLEELAGILHEYNEPVVFLNGHAELGPRALGNRSILAAAVLPEMKTLLNKVKGRESYRPVAPICLEEDAAEIFDPGFPDPYMLYEHKVREDWKDKVPAICHLDGTARLQTVNREQNPHIYELLQHYKKISNIPLLCNTSANLNGKGFFPDVKTVTYWDNVNFIWNNGTLYFKKGSFHPEVLKKNMVLR